MRKTALICLSIGLVFVTGLLAVLSSQVSAERPEREERRGNTQVTISVTEQPEQRIETRVEVNPQPEKPHEEKRQEEVKERQEPHKSATPNITISNPEEPLTGIKPVEVKTPAKSSVDLQLQTTEGKVGTVHVGRVTTNPVQGGATYRWDTTNVPNGDYKLYGTVNRERDTSVIVGPIPVTVDNSPEHVTKKFAEVKTQRLQKDIDTQKAKGAISDVGKKELVRQAEENTQKVREFIEKQSVSKKLTGDQKQKMLEVAIKEQERVEELVEKQSAKSINKSTVTPTPSQTTGEPREVIVGPTTVPAPAAEVTQEAEPEVVLATTKDIVFPSEFDPKVIPENNITQVEKVENTKLENNNVALTFRGKAEPNTIITLLIYSNPIVVTVKTDENGMWTYNLEKPLQPGKHVAYAVVPQADGTKVRSQVSEFFISPAYAASSNNESLILASATENTSLTKFAFAAVSLITSGIIALLAIFWLKKFRKNTTVTKVVPTTESSTPETEEQ